MVFNKFLSLFKRHKGVLKVQVKAFRYPELKPKMAPQEVLENEWITNKKRVLANLIDKLESGGKLPPDKESLSEKLEAALKKEKDNKTILAVFEIYALCHPEAAYRKETLRNLASIAGSGARPIFEKAANDISYDVKLELVRLSEELGFFPLLKKISENDQGADIRKAAFRALLVK